jgi:hypothetical protein
MIYRGRSRYARLPGIARNLQSGNRNMQAVGQGDFIRMRDEHGNVWAGSASVEPGNIVRYRFRDAQGRYITGIADTWGVILRNEHGETWRGFLD